MAMRSTLRKLTSEDLAQLHARIRESWYADLEGHLAWLSEKGYEITRSSLHRYVVLLRDADAHRGDEKASLAVRKTNSQGARKRLLERLGALRLEEIGILERLRELDDVG